MNIHPILIRLLGACLLAVAPLAATAANALVPMVDATWEACKAGNYAGRVPQMQRDLYRIYGGKKGFEYDAGEKNKPLGDGVFGPVTRRWLVRFCQEHPFKVRKAHFDADVAAELAGYRVKQPAAIAATAAPQAPLPPLEQTYRYDPDFPRKPGNVALMLPRLQTLTDLYSDKALFDDAVERALKGLDPDPATRQRIVDFSALDGYLLPSDKLSKLKGASPALLEKLMLKADIDYVGADDFHADLAIAVGEGAEKAEYARHATQIDGLARTTHYRIPATLAADLAAASALEAPVAVLYKNMAKVEYPSQTLFRSALLAHLERALGMCQANRHQKEGLMDDDGAVKALWVLVDPARAHLERVMYLRAKEGRCNQAELVEELRLLVIADGVLFRKLDNAFELVSIWKAPPLARQAGPGAVDGCGCAHDARGGMSYGFYPLWTDATKGRLDFDVLSRIGLYGLTIGDRGNLRFPAGVDTPPWTLMEAAHRHMTRVDWVLYKGDWNSVGEAGMAPLLANLRASIKDMLALRPPGGDGRGTALASFGLEQGPSAGDGIVLRFERFPSGQGAQQALREFVKVLAKELRDMKPARQLFMMVTDTDILGADDASPDETRPFSPAGLLTLMKRANWIEEAHYREYSKHPGPEDLKVLVLMQEPTSSNKLRLRAGIENALFSNERVRALRNMIPVVEYDGRRPGQLNDDIVYFQDNFGGIGFWPLPFASAADDTASSNTGTQLLRQYFREEGLEGGFVAEAIDLICPNRAWLRWLAWISALVAIVAGMILARCHNCGTRLDNPYFMAVMVALIALPFVVIAALVVGDPLFKSESGVHWVLAAILIVVVIVPGVYGLLKPVRKLP
jgi:hypothetical protein